MFDTDLSQNPNTHYIETVKRLIDWGGMWCQCLFTVVHQQGELVQSQWAVGRHAEEGEELTEPEKHKST